MTMISWPRVWPAGDGNASVTDTITASGSINKAYRYAHGYGKAHFPVPATLDDFEVSGIYLTMSNCPLDKRDGVPCFCCVNKYLDSLEWFCEVINEQR